MSMRGNGRTRSKYAVSVCGGRGSSSDDKPANYNPATLRLRASTIKAGELGNERGLICRLRYGAYTYAKRYETQT